MCREHFGGANICLSGAVGYTSMGDTSPKQDNFGRGTLHFSKRSRVADRSLLVARLAVDPEAHLHLRRPEALLLI